MRKTSILIGMTLVVILGCGISTAPRNHFVPPDLHLADFDSTATQWPETSTLQTVIDMSRDGDTLLLSSGVYYAHSQEFLEPLCGNCAEQRTEVKASTGFVIRGKGLTIIGCHKDSTILVTGAGYGVYFEGAGTCRMENLKITGGVRDLDGAATDAAVVIRGTLIYINQCAMADNIHRQDSVVVGIGGVFGREGAEIYLSNCDITNNGWDGVALYRGASADISDCVISKGRGAGIGVTWDAHCVAKRSKISEYWKGIGAFGTSTVIAHNNLVFDNLGWGIIGTGESYLDAANNVVYHNGNCGIAPWSQESRGRFVNNIIVNNGWRKEWVCPCVGVWNYGDAKRWQIYNNLVWNNEAGDYKDIANQTGKNGNISADPLFVGEGDFHLKSGSPAIDAGYREINDADGSPSDLGIYGGTSGIQWRED